MIGIRATSGSVAIRLRKVVIACSESSRSASMFTSRMLAPPRTWSSATSTAAWKSPASTSRRKRAEPVTFVRSPIDRRSRCPRVITSGSRPLKRAAGGCARAARRGADPVDGGRDRRGVLGRRAAAAADDVDEAVLGELAQEAARVVRLLVVAAERVRQAGVRVAGDVASRRRARARRRTAASAAAPSEQLTPTISGSACSTEIQNASTRLPGQVPAATGRSTVNEIQSGSSGATSLRGGDRGLRVQRVEDRLDEQQVDAALAQAADLLGVGLDDLVEGVRAVGRVVDARGERERHVQRADRAGDEAAADLVRRAPARAARPRRSSRRRRPRARSRPGRSRSR